MHHACTYGRKMFIVDLLYGSKMFCVNFNKCIGPTGRRTNGSSDLRECSSDQRAEGLLGRRTNGC